MLMKFASSHVHEFTSFKTLYLTRELLNFGTADKVLNVEVSNLCDEAANWKQRKFNRNTKADYIKK